MGGFLVTCQIWKRGDPSVRRVGLTRGSSKAGTKGVEFSELKKRDDLM